MEDIFKTKNINKVSTLNDHCIQPRSELLVEPLITLVEPLPRKQEATKGHYETLPQHLKYIDQISYNPNQYLSQT